MPHRKNGTDNASLNAVLLPIEKIAKKMGIDEKYIEKMGNYKAKISLDIQKSLKSKKHGKYILVSAVTPTPLGEGKTVTTIGLSMAFNKLNHKAVACIRQPSLGPVFGIKGGATGGGKSQVLPKDEINLHFTGDFHAVTTAHNLCAAYLDNHIYRGNPLDINVQSIVWHRVLDISDRVLRNVTLSSGSKADGPARKSGFDITAASEIMAILSLSENLGELRERIGKIIVAYNKKGAPVTAEQLKVAGPMTVLLKDALKPNLVQTIENTPCLVHTGPFANIAHGSNSIIADRIALATSEFVVTESGFGADMGAEKFFNIKCRKSGLVPDAVVLVCSIRALKIHSGDFEIKAGRAMENIIFKENISAIERGSSNLDKQIENIKSFGVPVIVCLNKFDTDTDKELEAVKRLALSSGAADCVVSQMWQMGSEGGLDLARSVIKTIKEQKTQFRFLYMPDLNIKEKISRIAKTLYGAKEIAYTDQVEQKIKALKPYGVHSLPICMAKTQFSLSHDPERKGRPRNFKLPITDVHMCAGAGFVWVSCDDIKTMPGLPGLASLIRMDIDKAGVITGL